MSEKTNDDKISSTHRMTHRRCMSGCKGAQHGCSLLLLFRSKETGKNYFYAVFASFMQYRHSYPLEFHYKLYLPVLTETV